MGSLAPVRHIYSPASTHWVGDGFPVRNLFPSNRIFQEVSPFLLLDYAGPRRFEASESPHGVGEHPHRGFETVTVLYQGELEHRDSAGNAGRLKAGDVQWMTAASGVVHEEMHGREFARRGGTFEAIQLWVNLPRKNKMDPPKYQDIAEENIPALRPAKGILLRVIAGDFQGTRGCARTYTPVFLWDLRMEKDARWELPLPPGQNRALFLCSGALRLNDSETLQEAQLAVVAPQGEALRLHALENSKLIAFGGEPIAEPVVQGGPFVMNSRQEIIQAMEDYQSGKMGHLH